MNQRPGRVLILDFDEDALITLEQIFEDAGFDTITSWDTSEVLHLLEEQYFDFLVIGDHPPELDAAKFLREVHERGHCGECFVMRSDVRQSEVERLKTLGAIAVISKHDRPSILEQVQKYSTFPIQNCASKIATEQSASNGPLDVVAFGCRSKTA